MAGKYKKIVIVTGGSSGIGRCTASALRDSGCIVYEFSRRNIPMEGITHTSHFRRFGAEISFTTHFFGKIQYVGIK